MQHFIFSWEFVIVNLNVLNILEQDIFNTMPAHRELDFQSHTVKQISSWGYMSVACLWRR